MLQTEVLQYLHRQCDYPQKAKKLTEVSFFVNKWLGYEDSNLGMPESESGALPLGDTPTGCVHRGTSFEFGWGTRIRTSECRNQNPVPYRLAIPQQIFTDLPMLTDSPEYGGYDGIRTCDPIIMSDVL